MSFENIYIVEYSDKSFVVQGDTKIYKDDLKNLGGKYNARLRNGPGWIFFKNKERDVESYIKNGKMLGSSTKTSYQSASVDKHSILLLTKKIDNLCKTVNKMEKLILKLMKEQPKESVDDSDSDSESDNEKTPVMRRRLLSKK